MAYKKYNSANNAFATLAFPIDDTDLTCVLQWKYWRMPTANFILKVTHTASGVVTGRENIYVTTRTGANCTGLIRAYEPVPTDDDATTNIQQALNFDAGDLCEVVISNEVIKDIQDSLFWKLDSDWGLRTWMLKSQNIWATNWSPNITVADTTWWINWATITWTWITWGTTIVSFVPNTSAVLSANYTWVTWTVSVQVWIRYAIEIDENGNEIKKSIKTWSSMSASETILKRKADWSLEEVTPAMILSAAWQNISVTPVEAWVTAWVPVWLIQDWLYKVQTENATSNTSSTATIINNIEKLSATTYAVCYSITNTMYVVICTVSWDTVTFWSATTVGAWTWVQWWMARIWANKLAFAYMDTAAAFPNHPIYGIVWTISWTTVTMWSAVTVVTPTTGGTWTYSLWSVCRIRDDAFAFQAYDQSGGGAAYMCTVSGTVPSAATTLVGTSWNASLMYLADNRFVLNWTGTVRMYEINPASLAVTTTYTGTANSSGWNTIARLSDTSFVIGWYSAITDANIYLYEKPGAGTVLTQNSIWTLSAINQVLIQIYDWIFWIHTWSTIIVMDTKIVIWTITWVSAIPSPQASIPIYTNWRLFYHSLTSLQSRIVRLARVMYAWIAIDDIGWYKPRFNVATVTWVVYPYVYYLQLNWTINRVPYTTWAVRIWKAVATNSLLLE